MDVIFYLKNRIKTKRLKILTKNYSTIKVKSKRIIKLSGNLVTSSSSLNSNSLNRNKKHKWNRKKINYWESKFKELINY